MIATLIALGAVIVMVTSLWSSIGPEHGAFPLCIALISLGFPIFVGSQLAKKISAKAFRISAKNDHVFKVLGVRSFDKLLTLIKWNALVLNMRKPVKTPADLQTLSFDLRSAATGHMCGLLLHVVVAALSFSLGHTEASLWILLPAIPLHAYPVMLQLVNLRRVDAVRVNFRA